MLIAGILLFTHPALIQAAAFSSARPFISQVIRIEGGRVLEEESNAQFGQVHFEHSIDWPLPPVNLEPLSIEDQVSQCYSTQMSRYVIDRHITLDAQRKHHYCGVGRVDCLPVLTRHHDNRNSAELLWSHPSMTLTPNVQSEWQALATITEALDLINQVRDFSQRHPGVFFLVSYGATTEDGLVTGEARFALDAQQEPTSLSNLHLYTPADDYSLHINVRSVRLYSAKPYGNHHWLLREAIGWKPLCIGHVEASEIVLPIATFASHHHIRVGRQPFELIAIHLGPEVYDLFQSHLAYHSSPFGPGLGFFTQMSEVIRMGRQSGASLLVFQRAPRRGSSESGKDLNIYL